MYETIGKVTLDLTKYPGEDLYSDGEVEDKLLRIARENNDLESVLTHEKDWAVLYHFSDIRKNIFEWYDFNKDADVLEIGAGCGAITGLLCEKCKSVTAVDLSKKRSTINAYRNNYSNLTIKVGNFKDIEFKEGSFDYVTLIGVFEYSISYMGDKDPFMSMLKKCKSFLKPGGVLFIAIENKYGLKYFAGAGEDHSGKLFEGITGYPEGGNVRTFSKNELQKMTVSAGFTPEFYYPYPDYKLPTQIFSDKRLPGSGDIIANTPAYDRDRAVFFDEARAFNEIIKDGYFPMFSNSFLVVCHGD